MELIIVILLIVIILGISTVFFANMLPKGRFDTFIRDISSTIKLARALSQMSGESQTFFVDIDNGIYGIEGRKSRQIPSGISFKIEDPFSGEIVSGRYELEVHAGIFETVSIMVSDNKRKAKINIDPVAGVRIEK